MRRHVLVGWMVLVVGSLATVVSAHVQSERSESVLQNTRALAPAVAPTLRQTTKKADGTSVTWTRDFRFPDFGEAWRDSRGVTWSDIAKNEDGSPRLMNWAAANEYCKDRGGYLPSKEDFLILAEFLSADTKKYNEGYRPQVLPNLTYIEDGKIHGLHFWSATTHNYDRHDFIGYSSTFSGSHGGIDGTRKDGKVAVRCVKLPPRGR